MEDLGTELKARGLKRIVIGCDCVNVVCNEGRNQAQLIIGVNLDGHTVPPLGSVIVKGKADKLAAKIALWGGLVT